ncbi:HD domain-containing protein [Streptomyces pactum]|uniref:HD domain-containing protein n=1 Tax=Streptomyces pactum TaxID=68249 RepID=UPI0037018101
MTNLDLDATGLEFPRTEVVLAALRLAEECESVPLFHHSLRTYFFGRLVGEQLGLRAGEDYDDQLLFLGCVLHDTGLSPRGDGSQRFEVDGADLAAEFLARQGLPAAEVEVVWDAIALHTTDTIALRKRPEIALVSRGARFDITGGPVSLPAGHVERVHAALPRLDVASALHEAIVGQTSRNPDKAPPFTLPGELHRQHTGAAWPTWEQLAATSEWDGRTAASR